MPQKCDVWINNRRDMHFAAFFMEISYAGRVIREKSVDTMPAAGTSKRWLMSVRVQGTVTEKRIGPHNMVINIIHGDFV